MSSGFELKYFFRPLSFSPSEIDSFIAAVSTVGGGEKAAAATRGFWRLKRAKKTAVAATAARVMVLTREKGRGFGVSAK